MLVARQTGVFECGMSMSRFARNDRRLLQEPYGRLGRAADPLRVRLIANGFKGPLRGAGLGRRLRADGDERLDERRLAALLGNQPRRLRDAQELVELFTEFRVRIGAVL